MLEFHEYTKILIGLMAIVNPVNAVPIFVAFTSNVSGAERKKIGKSVVIAVGLILLISMILGEYLLNFFGITINSFRVAGGILILLMAISMLHAKVSATVHTEEETAEEEGHHHSVAIVPLAMPLLAGPGAISTVILYAHRGTDAAHYAMVGVAILILCLTLWIVFSMIPWFSSHLTKTRINIFTRIMGLILAAIAIEFIANGLKGLFPVLA
ncbi:YchE family NAAT transporter [Hahella aquimaris]|uniref:YchE family NAAT transporter n=1 Tax=Hahella sp. HNIBRBA332 TaxID=3015983 RepID=UPI00273CCC9B|nr:YchE family NAAT transporter [Hahella sp. HNIBRBA332]WLQ14963.1 YchE family NAAT transporter [Hahella sp. HNIBRBA332]